MTQACGMLELKEQRDAFLTSLCRFTLTDAADSDHSAGSRGETAATTSGERPALLAHTCSPVKKHAQALALRAYNISEL